MVSEIYSPPRVTKMLEAMPELKLVPGFAWDITCVDPDDGERCDDEASFESPPAYDPRANGSIENAVQVAKGVLRTVKLCLEARIERRIPDDHPLVTWMVEHAAWLSTVCKKGEDGKTASQRARGRPFGKRTVGFGEKILFKLPDRGPRHDERGAPEARW